jgi:AcrR family transcriptional regulator
MAWMTAVVRPYRGVSAEERRAERRARLKAACLDLIGEAGVVSVTAEAVSDRAGLTKRYFYESFTDRDGLLYEVMDDFFVQVRAEMLDALAAADSDAPRRAHIIARVLIDYLRRDRRQARLYVEAAGQPTLRARREEAFDVYTRLLLDAFPVEPGDDWQTPDVQVRDQRRTVAGLIVVAGTTQAAISWLQGTVDLTRDDVIAEIARLILTALRPRPNAG